MDELREMMKKLILSQQRNTEQIEELKIQIAETSSRQDIIEAKLSKKVINFDTTSEEELYTAEEFFYYALKEKPYINKIKFDDVSLNIKSKNKQVEDEFDIVLYNGNSIGIVEIKHKVHPNDIDKLITKKLTNFKLLFPDYANYNFYLGIGGMSVPQEVSDKAKENGLAVFRQKGEFAEIDSENLSVY